MSGEGINCKVIRLANKEGVVISLKNGLEDIPAVQSFDDSNRDCNWKQRNHLYFTSQDNIQKGEWMHSVTFNSVFKAAYATTSNEDYSKVIASTDRELGIYSIPEYWICKYVAANGKITEVKLEGQKSAKHKIKLLITNEVCVLDKFDVYKTSTQAPEEAYTWTDEDMIAVIKDAYFKGFRSNNGNMYAESWLDDYKKMKALKKQKTKIK